MYQVEPAPPHIMALHRDLLKSITFMVGTVNDLNDIESLIVNVGKILFCNFSAIALCGNGIIVEIYPK